VLEARISSSRGSLYFAAVDAAAPNLRTLRRYVRDFANGSAAERVHLELQISRTDAAAPGVRIWLAELAATGVRVTHTK
jgi:hypothetical protein